MSGRGWRAASWVLAAMTGMLLGLGWWQDGAGAARDEVCAGAAAPALVMAVVLWRAAPWVRVAGGAALAVAALAGGMAGAVGAMALGAVLALCRAPPSVWDEALVAGASLARRMLCLALPLAMPGLLFAACAWLSVGLLD